MLAEARRVEAVPMKRTAPPQTDYPEHDEIETLFKNLPRQGVLSLRDRAIGSLGPDRLVSERRQVRSLDTRNARERRGNLHIESLAIHKRSFLGSEGVSEPCDADPLIQEVRE
jgi:hypothetical protein